MAHRASRSGRFRARILLTHALLACALILSLGLTTGLSPSPVGAAAIVVTTTTDTIDVGDQKGCGTIAIGDLPGSDGLISLREAICAANNTAGDDTISFSLPDSAPWVVTLQAGEVPIASNLTIVGPGKADLAIDGAAASRVLNVSGGTVAISDVTIRNGSDSLYGGGIANSGALTLTDSVVTGNTSGESGGGIFSGVPPQLGSQASAGATGSVAAVGITLTLTRTTVSENRADYQGGGIHSETGQVTLNDSTVADNTSGYRAGGIFNGSAMTLSGSTIDGNSASGDAGPGGGILNYGTLTATNSTISGNSTDGSGGGLYNGAAGEAALRFVTVTGNTAGSVESGAGGGIYQETSSRESPAAIGATTILGSLVVGNISGEGADCSGNVVSAGHNLVGLDTGCPTDGAGDLAADDIATILNTVLADNGGATRTHALVAGSAALDAGDDAACADATIANGVDQRGIPRPQGARCDIGAFEREVPVTLTVQTEGTGTVAVSPPPTSSSGTPSNMAYTYPPDTVVTLTATPGSGQVFARWTIDGAGTPLYGKGWASPLTITLDTNHTALATFAARPTFSDVPGSHSAYGPITELTARGIIKGYTQFGCDRLGTALPCFGPADLTERAQVAALLVRLLGLEGENHGNGGFTDLDGLHPELQLAVGTMAHYGIMVGYGGGQFGPFDKISYLQMVQVISRGFVFKGYWTKAVADDPTIYPNVALSPAERLELVTFVQNAGPLPGFANTTDRAPLDQPAPRDWAAEALWQALNASFGVDQPGKGGFVP